MVREIRQLDPKPGLKFNSPPAEPVTPDVIVRAAPDGGWRVDLNSDALPRVIANRSFYAALPRTARAAVRSFADEAWTNATWIVRSLEQRARTILKVATEIVRHQDAFFTYGVAHLRPLNLKIDRRGGADARIDHLARHRQQVHGDAARAVRDEVFLLDRHFLLRRRRGVLVRGGAPSHPPDDRGEDPKAILSDDAIVEGAAGHRHRHRPAHRRQISRGMHIPSSSVRGGRNPSSGRQRFLSARSPIRPAGHGRFSMHRRFKFGGDSAITYLMVRRDRGIPPGGL
jgi:hypothetical protein